MSRDCVSQHECFIKMMRKPDIQVFNVFFWFDDMLCFNIDFTSFQKIVWWEDLNGYQNLRYLDDAGYCHNACPIEATRAYENWVVETIVLGDNDE